MDTKRFENAMDALNTGHVLEALSEFDSLADLASDAQEKGTMLLGQALSLMHRGLIAEARERWSRSTACWRNLYTDYIEIVLCALENRREEGISRIREFLSHRNELFEADDQNLYSDAAERLGYLLFESEQYAAAIEPFINAAETAVTEGRRAEMQLYLGTCYTQVGDFQMAEQALKESLPANTNDPLWPSVQYQRGRLHFRQTAYVQAKSSLELCLMTTEADSDLARNASDLLAEVERHLPREEKRIS